MEAVQTQQIWSLVNCYHVKQRLMRSAGDNKEQLEESQLQDKSQITSCSLNNEERCSDSPRNI